MRASHLLRLFPILCMAFTAHSGEIAEKKDEAKIIWVKWTPDLFERAQKENKLVLLDLEAVWCHWCHVMEKITYSDPDVVALINKNYIAVRADQDANPDLSNRYEDYGWPATIMFDKTGKELVKRSGYMPPKPMFRLLQAVVDDPTPGPSVRPEPKLEFATTSVLDPVVRTRLSNLYVASYDPVEKGWGEVQKYLDWYTLEYTLARAQAGDAAAATMAKETFVAHQSLIDPVWGGVYQYSTGGKWNEQHFEKLMTFQAETLRVYALAYALMKDPLYLKSAQAIQHFIRTFLKGPEGAFYVSQDADVVQGEHSAEYFALSDTDRRAKGIPRVDTHLYARDNGLAIDGLATYAMYTNNAEALSDALTAAQWLLANRTRAGGGFCHEKPDEADLYLGDSLAPARAFLALYMATGDLKWRAQAENTVQFIDASFQTKDGAGYKTSKMAVSPLGDSKPQREENVALARIANLLQHYTQDKKYREIAERAFRFLTAPEIANRFPHAAVLTAADELANEPLHLVIVGAKDSPEAAELFKEAGRIPSTYKCIEWLDPKAGALKAGGIDYPPQPAPAAYLCYQGQCSTPAKTPQALVKVDEKIVNKKK